jgi:hypothetical protein
MSDASPAVPGPGTTKLTAEFVGTVIAPSVDCRGCGYDLQGLRVDGRCPECGAPLAPTIEALLDPATARLPRLANPRGVGNALWWLTVILVVALALLVITPVWNRVGLPDRVWGIPLPSSLPILACIAACLGLLPVAVLRPAPGSETAAAVRWELWLLVIGLLGLAVGAVTLWMLWRSPQPGTGPFPLLAPLPLLSATKSAPTGHVVTMLLLSGSLVCLLAGIGGVLEAIGARSTAYRRSRAGRQGVHAMIACAAAMGLGALVQWLTARLDGPGWLFEMGKTVLSVSSLMLLIGLLYLLLTAWGIRTALIRPPPTIDELLVPALPADTHVPEIDAGEPDAFE